MDEAGVCYIEVLVICELLTSPLREGLKSGEMAGCHDHHSISLLEIRNFAANASDDASTFE